LDSFTWKICPSPHIRQTGLSLMCHMAESWLMFRIWMDFETLCPRRSSPN
ncbi:Hypothetical predicted protein, partial [Marmota monax]